MKTKLHADEKLSAAYHCIILGVDAYDFASIACVRVDEVKAAIETARKAFYEIERANPAPKAAEPAPANAITLEKLDAMIERRLNEWDKHLDAMSPEQLSELRRRLSSFRGSNSKADAESIFPGYESS